VSDTAPEISTRVVSVFFMYFQRLHGRERLQRAVDRIGGEPSLDYLLDPENFVSLEYLVRVANVLTEEAGDPQFLRKAGEHQLDDPRMLGFVFYLARSLGSPKLYYRLAVKTAPSFNRVGEMSVEELSDRHARLRYRSRKPEGTRLICEGRIGQLASAPTVWGLPPAEVRELECQVLGAPACVYDIRWLPARRPLLRALAGSAVGLAAGATAGGLGAALTGGAVGALAALAAVYRTESREKSRRIMDSVEASSRAMAELQRRFEELSDEMRRRERAEAALVEAQKMEAIGRLSGGIAHDFNNILTVILSSADFARKRIAAPADVRANLDEIEGAATRAADLTRRLLAFARREIVEPRVLDLADSVRQLDGLLRRLLGEDVRLALDLAPERLCVRMDPTQLQQLLLNLAANARDAMPTGGVLRVETRATGGQVLLTLADTGVGMDEDTRRRVFEPFFTTKETGKGTGLGLATCHGIVHQAGGTITVDSAPGQGTTFRISLPRDGSAPIAATPVPPRALRPGSETILVAEDDPHVRRVIAHTLGGGGYRVIEAASAPEAISLAGAEPGQVHLLVSDVIMPELDGRALADQLRAARPGLRALFVSGYSNEVISSRGVLDQGLRLLRKPFTSDELLAKVRAVLDAPEREVSSPP
jgi:signal transduction histidine kinase/ActR/RegA family two-component response regulator